MAPNPAVMALAHVCPDWFPSAKGMRGLNRSGGGDKLRADTVGQTGTRGMRPISLSRRFVLNSRTSTRGRPLPGGGRVPTSCGLNLFPAVWIVPRQPLVAVLLSKTYRMVERFSESAFQPVYTALH